MVRHTTLAVASGDPWPFVRQVQFHLTWEKATALAAFESSRVRLNYYPQLVILSPTLLHFAAVAAHVVMYLDLARNDVSFDLLNFRLHFSGDQFFVVLV